MYYTITILCLKWTRPLSQQKNKNGGGGKFAQQMNSAIVLHSKHNNSYQGTLETQKLTHKHCGGSQHWGIYPVLWK